MKILKIPYKNPRYKIDEVLDVLVDDDIYDEVKSLHFSVINKGYLKRPSYYFRFRKPGYYTYLHRHIVGAKTRNEITDHINGNTLDCQRQNLRIVDSSINSINAMRYNPTGFKGVAESGPNAYKAKFYYRVGSKKFWFYSQSFKTPKEASEAYNLIAKAFYGEYVSTKVSLDLMVNKE